MMHMYFCAFKYNHRILWENSSTTSWFSIKKNYFDDQLQNVGVCQYWRFPISYFQPLIHSICVYSKNSQIRKCAIVKYMYNTIVRKKTLNYNTVLLAVHHQWLAFNIIFSTVTDNILGVYRAIDILLAFNNSWNIYWFSAYCYCYMKLHNLNCLTSWCMKHIPLGYHQIQNNAHYILAIKTTLKGE